MSRSAREQSFSGSAVSGQRSAERDVIVIISIGTEHDLKTALHRSSNAAKEQRKAPFISPITHSVLGA